MTTTRNLLAATVLLVSGTAFAQTPPPATPATPANQSANDVQRNINQQDHIEKGLQSGQLSTKEASQLERDQTHVNKMEQHDLAKGPMTAQEQAQLSAAQKKTSQDISTDRNNTVTGNPNAPSSQRMQADVQRNANQQQRIENGVQSGKLNDRQAANLEHGQALVDHSEAKAGANGTVSAQNQQHITTRAHNQANRIHTAHKNANARSGN